MQKIQSKLGPADQTRINVAAPDELYWWCRHLEVNPGQLRRAVREVGEKATAVRRLLRAK